MIHLSTTHNFSSPMNNNNSTPAGSNISMTLVAAAFSN